MSNGVTADSRTFIHRRTYMLHKIHTLNNTEEFISMTEFITPSEPAGSYLYFDIETTGLSARSSFLYLIGCMYLLDGEVKLEQFFSEGPDDEPLLLSSFAALASRFKTLVHFNGHTFDIPYVLSKSFDHNIDTPVSSMMSFDLYRKLKPLKEILNTDSMKQKALEKACGIDRVDRFDGGELISVYNRYLACKRLEKIRSFSPSGYKPSGNSGLTSAAAGFGSSSDELLKLLLLHNYEDVYNMIKLTGLLGIRAFFEGRFSISGIDRSESSVSVTLSVPSVISLPKLRLSQAIDPLSPPLTLTSSKDLASIVLTIPVCETELKLFFDNYKDYWYLPAEDNAVHDSIGSFLDRSVKVKATKQTSYVRSKGRFFPLPKGVRPEGIKTFRSDYKSKLLYVNADEQDFFTDGIVTSYLSSFI